MDKIKPFAWTAPRPVGTPVFYGSTPPMTRESSAASPAIVVQLTILSAPAPWTDADRTKFRMFVTRVRDNYQNGVSAAPTKEEG